MDQSFRLPEQIRRLIPLLAEKLREQGDALLSDILRSATIVVDEGVDYDNWDGGTWGHALSLLVPSEVYMRIDLDNLDQVEKTLKDRLTTVLRGGNEHLAYLSIQVGEVTATPAIPLQQPRQQDADLWGDESDVRLFISHRAQDKKAAAELKTACHRYGISGFVAHETIEPIKEWQSEIERALQSMDALVALITPEFADSNWTDQEVGWSMGRGVPVVPVRLGRDPYGFIGKYQGIQGMGQTSATIAQVVAVMLSQRFDSTRQQTIDALLSRLSAAADVSHAKDLLDVLQASGAPAEATPNVATALGTFLELEADRMAADSHRFSATDFDEIVSMARAAGTIAPAITIGISVYVTSPNFNAADARFRQAVLPFLDEYSHEQMALLLEGIESNNQVYHRGRAATDHALILQAAERLSPPLDWRAYPQFTKSLRS